MTLENRCPGTFAGNRDGHVSRIPRTSGTNTSLEETLNVRFLREPHEIILPKSQRTEGLAMNPCIPYCWLLKQIQQHRPGNASSLNTTSVSFKLHALPAGGGLECAPVDPGTG